MNGLDLARGVLRRLETSSGGTERQEIIDTMPSRLHLLADAESSGMLHGQEILLPTYWHSLKYGTKALKLELTKQLDSISAALKNQRSSRIVQVALATTGSDKAKRLSVAAAKILAGHSILALHPGVDRNQKDWLHLGYCVDRTDLKEKLTAMEKSHNAKHRLSEDDSPSVLCFVLDLENFSRWSKDNPLTKVKTLCQGLYRDIEAIATYTGGTFKGTGDGGMIVWEWRQGTQGQLVGEAIGTIVSEPVLRTWITSTKDPQVVRAALTFGKVKRLIIDDSQNNRSVEYVGYWINLAHRLQAHAGRNSMVMTQEAQRVMRSSPTMRRLLKQYGSSDGCLIKGARHVDLMHLYET